MNIKRFTLFLGITFLAIGILGFVPAFVTYGVLDPDFMTHGMLLGIFPVNGVHNLIHLAFGVWALLAYKDVAQARTFCRSNAVIYGLLAILGFFPNINTLFGLVPIHGNDVWLHGLIALATAYYGFVWNARPVARV